MSRSLPAPAWAVLGVVLGFVAGGILPRQELSDLEADLAQARDELVEARSRAARRSPLSVVGLDRAVAPTSRPEAPPPRDVASAPSQDRPEPSARDTGPSGAQVIDVGDPLDPMEEYELAVDAQRVRIDQSRAALIEQADLDDGQVGELDAVVGDMNDRLSELGDDLLALMESGSEPDSAELLGVTHDVSGVLYDAQTSLDQVIGQEGVEASDADAREIWNYIDLESFRDTVEAAGGLTGSGGGTDVGAGGRR